MAFTPSPSPPPTSALTAAPPRHHHRHPERADREQRRDDRPHPITGTLSESGTLVNSEGNPFVLVANHDASTSPTGSFYTFTLELDNAPLRAFDAVPPTASGCSTRRRSAWTMGHRPSRWCGRSRSCCGRSADPASRLSPLAGAPCRRGPRPRARRARFASAVHRGVQVVDRARGRSVLQAG